MAKFLTTLWVSSYIEDIIKNANKEVVLVSPYLQLSQSFFERLQDAQDHDVDITIIYGKSELKPSEMKMLEELTNLSLYFSNNLHAKCYFNESSMVITSMNMYEYSEKTNREMGVFITKMEDEEIYNDALKETQSIIRSSKLVSIKSKSKSKKKVQKVKVAKNKSNSKNGHCIRCSQDIPLNLDSPYCKKCYQSWSFFENGDFEEKICHSCGEDNNSTMVKPVCYSCYKMLN